MDAESRRRLRFDEFKLSRFPNGRCKAWVQMEWTEGRTYLGEAEGTQTKQGELQAAASATVNAAASAVEGRLELELRGVKAVRAFDAWVIVACVTAQAKGLNLRLLGVSPSSGSDTSRGAVMAVLDATNRVLAKYLGD
jgi:hypothetical protein